MPKKILFVCILALLLFLVYGIFPNRWYHVLYIYGGSMHPTFFSGDLIVITPKPENLEPGMVLTMNVNGQLVTHRLVDIETDGTILTKGDNNPVIDDWGGTSIKVVGLYRFKIPYLGYLVDLMDVFTPSASGAWFIDEDLLDISISTKSEQEAVSGTSISAALSANGAYDESLNVFSVNGDICIDNQGEVNTAGLKIFAQVEYKNGGDGKFQPLSTATFYLEPAEVLLPGENRCYAYSINFDPVEEADYRLSVQAAIENHSGWMPGGPHCDLSEICPFGPEVKTGFELPEIPVTEGTLESATPEPEMTETPAFTPEPSPLPEATKTPVPSASPDNSSDNLLDETPTPEEFDCPESTPDAPLSD